MKEATEKLQPVTVVTGARETQKLDPRNSFTSGYLSAWQEYLLVWEQDVERCASAAGERLSESVFVAILNRPL